MDFEKLISNRESISIFQLKFCQKMAKLELKDTFAKFLIYYNTERKM